MTTPRRGINSVENENTLVVQKYLGLVVEYLKKGKLHSSSGRPSSSGGELLRPMLTVNVNVHGEASFPGFLGLCSRSRSCKSFSVLTINVNVALHGQRRPIGPTSYDYSPYVVWLLTLRLSVNNRVIFELMTVGHDCLTHFLRVLTRSDIFFRSHTHSGSVWGRGPSPFKWNWEWRRVTPFMDTYTDLMENSVDVYADDCLHSRSRSRLTSASRRPLTDVVLCMSRVQTFISRIIRELLLFLNFSFQLRRTEYFSKTLILTVPGSALAN